MKTQIVLTVSESKRLIAKGVCKLAMVQRALKQGLIIIPTGSTNGYIIEELTDIEFDKTGYMTGQTLPARVDPGNLNRGDRAPDVVLEKGRLNRELDRITAAENMDKDDVFIKGANALNYEKGVVGVLIGHPAGGTIGGAIGHIIGKRGNLVIPVGLEKCISSDIYEMAELANKDNNDYDSSVPRLWPLQGTIVTEIEALEILFDVKVSQLAAGGLGGAEGSVRLLADGNREEIDKLKEFIDEIQGEPEFYQ
ncbi:MAG: hypothetical protein ACOCQN_02980 [Halanaerobiaceae bacterium]